MKKTYDHASEEKRVFGLDIIRASAILLVVLCHSFLIFGQKTADRLEDLSMLLGYFGVEMFFVLSGFLIGGILLRTIEAGGRFGVRDLTRFWTRRWLRTLPMYFVVLILLNVMFFLVKGRINGEWLYFVFMQNFAWQIPQFMMESWSLAIEEWFYLLFPIVILALMAVMGHGRKRMTVIVAIIVFFAAGLAFRLYFSMVAGAAWDAGVRRVVVCRLDSIMFGVIVAYVNHYHGKLMAKTARASLVTGCALILYVIVRFALMGFDAATEGIYPKVLLFSFTDAAFALMLPAFFAIKTVKPGIVTNAVTHISRVSYSMYLLHSSVILAFIVRLVTIRGGLTVDIVAYPVYWAATVITSTITYNIIEKPFIDYSTRLRRKWSD